ncbi:hypothetical protein FPZ12_019985 [Amycolatopsis acidicola]|uniref:DUF6314 domain-containing protein n=1 Tax=Amycolatopsis acidicola TaxID=2596893 RepID=A0A5N0V3Q7_9PSEU|nr:DUF6314 family protein [Amycolatopsis acidicola]KAA9159647.1 hypothetical protein FPZ12_019985 [Amycolatopsis acidicola]
MTGARELFARLPGEWRLRREMPGLARMSGTARFRELEPGVLHYREDGHLTLDDGQVLEVYREYHYRLEDQQIRICFAEPGPPRTLHVLRPGSTGSASDVHLCGPDTYTGHYEFTGEDTFTVRMRVTGPHKDYSILSGYERTTTRTAPTSLSTLDR